jgi:DNA-binding NarL/FixJ family response regulator
MVKATNMMQLIIATPQRLLLEGIRFLLKGVDDVKLSATVINEGELFSVLAKEPSDVILIEPMLALNSSVSLVQRLRETNASAGIVILGNQNETQDTIELLRAGARGYVGKKSTSDDLISAIRRVGLGGTYLSDSLAEQLALSVLQSRPRYSKMTPRESEIFALLARGVPNSEIAELLCLSVKTVSSHKSRIFLRMGFTSTSELIRYSITGKLVTAF